MQIGTLEWRSPVVTQRVFDILTENADELTLKGVYYGYQQLIPTFPAISIESGAKARGGAGTHRFEIRFSVLMMLEHGQIQSTEINKKESEELSELVEQKLHEDFTLGGLVLFGYVTGIDPGVRFRESEMIRATKLTWEAISREGF